MSAEKAGTANRRRSPAGCPACGQTLHGAGRCSNRWCARVDRGFSVVFAAGVHEGALRRAIVAYKYREQRWLAERFAGMLNAFVRKHEPWFEEFDLMVPVPAYQGPGARRKWDPVGLVFSRLVPLLGPGWDTDPGAVAKTMETAPMSGRSQADRLVLAEGPLRRSLVVPDPHRVRSARILVVDDVLTDGCTLREVARLLRRAGALEVAGLVVARPPWQASPPSRSQPTDSRSTVTGRPLLSAGALRTGSHGRVGRPDGSSRRGRGGGRPGGAAGDR